MVWVKLGELRAGGGTCTACLHVSLRQPVRPSLEETSVYLSVSDVGSITVTFNQLLKDFTAGGPTPAADSMEQFSLLLLIAPGSTACWHDVVRGVMGDLCCVAAGPGAVWHVPISTCISALVQGCANVW